MNVSVCVLSGRLTPEANCSKQAASRDAAQVLRSCRHGSVTMGPSGCGDLPQVAPTPPCSIHPAKKSHFSPENTAVNLL